MRRAALRLIALILAIAPAKAKAADAWKPASKWVLDLGESSCTLVRGFTAGERHLSLAFETKPPRQRYTLVLVVPDDVASGGSPPFPVKISAPGIEPINTEMSVEFGHDHLNRARVSLDNSTLGALSDAETIELEWKGHNLLIPIQGAPHALDVLQQCAQDLFLAWKIDPAAMAAVGTLPLPIDETSWITPEDYPRSAIMAGMEGTTDALLQVDEKGAVRSCRVVQSSSSAYLDDKTCDVFQRRAVFKPATDKSGKPISSWNRYGLRWILPRY